MVALRSGLLLAGAAVIAFGGCLWVPFHLDDHSLLVDPGLLSASGWVDAFELTKTRPLTWLTFWANFRVSFLPGGFHLVNLLIHCASVLMAVRVLPRLAPGPVALLAATVFALHPLQTEPVVYVFERATLLATLFCWVSLAAWTEGRQWRAVGWFVLALLSKEEVVAFPVLLLGLDWWRDRKTVRIGPLAAMLVLSVAAGLRVLWAGAVVVGSGVGPQAGVTTGEYFLSQGVAIWRYLREVVMPFGLTVESPVSVPAVWLGLAGWIGLGVLTVIASRRTGPWFAGGLVLLLPSSSVFAAAELSADRRMYFPLAAFALAAGLLAAKGRLRLGLATVWLAAVLIPLSLLQTWTWRSEEALWTRARELAPTKVRPLRQLARLGSPEAALPLLEDAKRLAPENAYVASDLGRTLLRLGQPAQALAEFGRALALAPNDAMAMNNRGVALKALGQSDAAHLDFQQALKADACLWDAHWNLKRLGAERPDDSRCRWTPEQRRLISAGL